jgi:hypothetical protein
LGRLCSRLVSSFPCSVPPGRFGWGLVVCVPLQWMCSFICVKKEEEEDYLGPIFSAHLCRPGPLGPWDSGTLGSTWSTPGSYVQYRPSLSPRHDITSWEPRRWEQGNWLGTSQSNRLMSSFEPIENWLAHSSREEMLECKQKFAPIWVLVNKKLISTRLILYFWSRILVSKI